MTQVEILTIFYTNILYNLELLNVKSINFNIFTLLKQIPICRALLEDIGKCLNFLKLKKYNFLY